MKKAFHRLLRHEPHEVLIQGEKISVHDEVFTPDPQISNSCSIILNNLPDLKGKTVLDMGTGTGVIAIVCARKGAEKVIAVDVSEKAIKNAEENILTSGLKNIELMESNLYEKTSGTFHYICANLPIADDLWSLGEKTGSIIERFLVDSKSHLKQGGKIFIPWISTSDIESIRAVARRLNYKEEILQEEKLGVTWYLIQLSL